MLQNEWARDPAEVTHVTETVACPRREYMEAKRKYKSDEPAQVGWVNIGVH